MNEKTIRLKVVMDLSIQKNGGCNNLQPINQKLLEEFLDENEPWLLIGIPNRDSLLQLKEFQRLGQEYSVCCQRHRKSRPHWRLSELCSAGIAWKSDVENESERL